MGISRLPPDHVHSYKRLVCKNGRKDMFRCMHPDCTHTASKAQLEGRRATCFLCSTQFVLTLDMLRRKIPHCGCRNLSIDQRGKLASFGKTVEDQQRIADQITMAILKGNQRKNETT